MSNAQFLPPAPYNEPVYQYEPGSDEKAAVKRELQALQQSTMNIPMVIGGERVNGRPTFNVVSPQNHKQVLATGQHASEADASAAMQAACAAQAEWSSLPWQERAAVFLRAADLLTGKYRARMNAATMLGQGKSVFQAEIDCVCELADFWRFNAAYMHELYEQQPESAQGIWNRTEYRGLEGFVYAIGPFNFTAISLNIPSAPAMMGCTTVWKPSDTALLASYIGLEILEEAGLPPGVINMVTGNPVPISNQLLNSPDLAGIHFTGSTATFQLLNRTVGENISNYRSYPRIVGETGGKDFVFAHPSAEVPALVTALIRGAFEYQGQKCSAASRAYIPASLWAEVKDQLNRQVSEIKMGDPSDFTNFMGAVIDERSFKKITGYIDQAKADADAEVIVGGDYSDEVGYFVRPTIIEAKSPHYRTMVEEIFGPVLTIHVYEDSKFEEMLKVCDESTPYSLTGAIFAKDRRTIHHMTYALRNAAGNFYINDKPTGAVVGQQPFGGSRASGTNDKAGSPHNLMRWVSMRTLKETFAPPIDYRYPHMDEA